MVADDAQTMDHLRHAQRGGAATGVVSSGTRRKPEYPREKCVHELFEEQVRRSPEATAVVFEEEELSYGELNARANRLAHYLRELGVKPDERVAICVERGFEMIVGLLAILKAGGGYVPLDPAYPEERLQYMLEDSAPVVLLTQRHLEDRFCGIGDGVPVLDLNATAAWQSFPESNPDADAVGLISKPSGLCDLHLRLHRPAQGRHGGTSWIVQYQFHTESRVKGRTQQPYFAVCLVQL